MVLVVWYGYLYEFLLAVDVESHLVCPHKLVGTAVDYIWVARTVAVGRKVEDFPELGVVATSVVVVEKQEEKFSLLHLHY